jgi:hypothetical protein
MATAKRTTMSKMNRERELKEKRARKQERKEQKKLATATAAAARAEAPTATPLASIPTRACQAALSGRADCGRAIRDSSARLTAYVPTWDPDRRIPPVARAVLEQVAMADTTSAQD